MANIHSESYVKSLFEEMSKSYGIVNLISSLGFAYFWRKQATYSLPSDSQNICDLMAGGGECLSHIRKRFGKRSTVHLVDWCEGMCNHARSAVKRKHATECSVVNASALDLPFKESSFDSIISTFGLKTLATHEIELLAQEIKRVLTPHGSISLLEFSIPRNRFVRFFFRIYVKLYVPFLGWVFLGNPDNYRMLWRYTKEFGNCKSIVDAFEKHGFEIQYRSRFLGSATQIIGYLK